MARWDWTFSTGRVGVGASYMAEAPTLDEALGLAGEAIKRTLQLLDSDGDYLGIWIQGNEFTADQLEAIHCTWGCGAEMVRHQFDVRPADALIEDMREACTCDDENAVCDRCGTNDRMDGSTYCEVCATEDQDDG